MADQSVTVGVVFEVAHDDARREVLGGSVNVMVIGNWDDLADYEKQRCIGILEHFLTYNRPDVAEHNPADSAPPSNPWVNAVISHRGKGST